MNERYPHWQAFLADESGQDMIEYCLLACLLALGAVTAMKSVATSFNNFIERAILKIIAIWP